MASRRPLPGTDLGIEVDLPNHKALDEFTCGDWVGAIEVALTLQTRAWIDWPSPPTLYRVSTSDDATVAFVLLEVDDYPHPSLSDVDEQPYLVIDVFAVSEGYHDIKDPVADPPRFMATLTMRCIEELVLPETDAVGLLLLVRAANEPARGFFQRFGFEDDAAGEFPDTSTREPTYCMRKLRGS